MKLNFEDGIKEIEINNDPKRILRVNVTDLGLIDRLEKSITDMQSDMDKLEGITLNADGTSALEECSEVVREVNKIMRRNFDAVFYPGASNIVFGKQNPLSTVNGKSIYENFMVAFRDLVTPELQKEANNVSKTTNKVNQYKEAYDKLNA